MAMDKQKLYLLFLKIVSYTINTTIVAGIVALVIWYILGLMEGTEYGG